MKRPIVLAALLLLAVPQKASAVRGTQLQEACSVYTETAIGNVRPQAAVNAGICMGYIMSAIDAYPIIHTAYPTVEFCAPKEVNYTKDLKVVTKFLRDHPEFLHKQAGMLVILAMSNAFPCNK